MPLKGALIWPSDVKVFNVAVLIETSSFTSTQVKIIVAYLGRTSPNWAASQGMRDMNLLVK